jgi:hypothetical protein
MLGHFIGIDNRQDFSKTVGYIDAEELGKMASLDKSRSLTNSKARARSVTAELPAHPSRNLPS